MPAPSSFQRDKLILQPSDLLLIESHLAAAEEVFVREPVVTARDVEFRDRLRDLLGKVVAERIRAEERATPMPQFARHEESIRVFEDVIRNFEEARSRMWERRRGAMDSVMVHIDESLALNERTLQSLHRVLCTAQEHLRQERSRVAG